jgi:hypothetical protein
MKKRKKTSKAVLVGLSLAAMLIAIPAALPNAGRLAAQQRAPQERTAEGSVVGKTDAAVPGAIVYLKDTKSNTVKTYIADKDGHFRFGELSQNSDYELWAESDGLRSKHKGISYLSSKNDYHFTLKLE